MVHIHLALEPHIGTPIVARAEVEAARLARAARHRAPFECHLADAYVKSFSLSGTGRAKRPELVVLVSHEVTRRGWNDVKEGEICKLPGVGPVSPEVARDIAQDAFLNGVFYDGVDLRQFARWTRNNPDPGSGRAGAGRATRIRRDPVRGLRQPFSDRVRPRRAARRPWSHLQRQPQTTMLELPPGQDET